MRHPARVVIFSFFYCDDFFSLNYAPFSAPAAIRAASQTFADVALAQSEAEARTALKPSPLKADRPAINLADKLKAMKSPPARPELSSGGRKNLVDSTLVLPSRKVTEKTAKSPKPNEEAKRKEMKPDHPPQRQPQPLAKVAHSNGANQREEAAASTPKRKLDSVKPPTPQRVVYLFSNQ